MSETRRVRSIARKIGNSWTMRTLGILLALDIALIALTFAGCAYFWERSVSGDGWSLELPRDVEWEEPRSVSTLGRIEYSFQSPDGVWHTAAIGPALEAALPFAAALGAFEAVLLLCHAAQAHRAAQKLLRPLDRMARDMRAVSQARAGDARYEDRLRDLENAIEHISPTQPGERLQTGARELTGLENAVNGLLVRMRESYRQQAQFVSDASHELRTPIAVIQGYAHLLARWGKDDSQVLDESIAAIQSESDYMKKLVEELLFLARGEIGRNPFEPKPISLTALICEVCEESAMIDSAHQWRFREAPSAGEARIVADAEMLKQCARVLCENAQKYTPEGGTISLGVAEAGEWTEFFVQDEGIGIGRKDISHIFDRFYRSDPARGRNSGGSGLGLAIANWIVERHGGSFDVVSSEGVGTRFTVRLPTAGPDASPTAQEAQ